MAHPAVLFLSKCKRKTAEISGFQFVTKYFRVNQLFELCVHLNKTNFYKNSINILTKMEIMCYNATEKMKERYYYEICY